MCLALCLLLTSVALVQLSPSDCYGGNTLSSLEDDIASIVHNVKPCVVTVTSQYDMRAVRGFNSAFERFQFLAEFRNSVIRKNVGSGIVFGEEIVVTSESVARAGAQVRVVLEDGRSYGAEVLGVDRNANVCVLRVAGLRAKPVTVGASRSVRIGSLVVLMGNSYGKLPTAALATVSGRQKVARTQGKWEIIQLSGPVHPGNGGGAVLNTRGELVAMIVGRLAGQTEQKFDRGGAGAGQQVESIVPMSGSSVGFALPAEEIRRVVGDLLKKGYVATGFLGVRIQDYGAGGTITRLGLSSAPGVEIAEVIPRSPAERAGLKSGDILSEFDNQPVLKAERLARMVSATRPGEKVRISFWRGSHRLSVTVTIGAGKAHQPKVPADSRLHTPGPKVQRRVLATEN